MTRKDIKAMICKMDFISDDEKIALYQRIISQMKYNKGYIVFPKSKTEAINVLSA